MDETIAVIDTETNYYDDVMSIGVVVADTFDQGRLPELSGFPWKDIMKLAAYKQHNPFIPEDAVCCKTGRPKSGYGVESIMQLLGHDLDLYPEI